MSIEKFTGKFVKEDLGCTIVVNETIRSITDPAALGLYCYLLTRPANWDINAKEIMRHFNMSKDKTYRLLTYLVEMKLLSRSEIRCKGQFVKHLLTLHLRPHDGNSPLPEKPDPVNQDAYKTYIYPLKNKDKNTNSESENSPIAATGNKKSSQGVELRELIDAYKEVFPDNPQPHDRVIATSLEKTLRTLMKRWPELDPQRRQITPDAFKRYLNHLRESAPKFALGTYQTANGATKKNNLETFARWNTVVKLLEGAYS